MLKCSFTKDSIPLWDVIITKESIQPNPTKVGAIGGNITPLDDIISIRLYLLFPKENICLASIYKKTGTV